MKHFYPFLFILLISSLGFGQTTIFNESGGGSEPTGWAFQNNVTSQPIDRGSYWLVENGSTNDFIITDSYDLSSFSSAEFSLQVATFGSGGANPARIEISFDGGSNFTQTEISNTPSSSSYINGGTFTLNSLTSQVVIRISCDGSSGRDVRLRSLELIASGSSGPANPDVFSASASSTTQIDLSYDDNPANDNVIIVFDTDNTFTAPSGPPTTVGNAFAGGTVLFNGSGSGTFNHTGLTENTTYYYAAYSYDGADYSIGLTDDATTPCSAIAVTNASPFQEGFEGGVVPPNCWASFRGSNGLGTNQDWQIETTLVNTGSNAAYVQYEDVDGGDAEDWLVTPALDLTGLTNSELSFFAVDELTNDFGTSYTIRVSTTSQTTIGSFTTVQTYSESDFGANYSQFTVDLSAYDGEAVVYVAFVMSQDDGDSWYLDDIEIKEATSSNANIIASGSFDPTDNIDYTAYDATSGLLDSNALKIGEFTIQDAGGAPSDTDNASTTLTDITFDVQGFDNIAALAIFNGSVNVSEVTTVTASTSFTGLSLEALDDGSLTFDIYATFDSTVTDNDQLQLTVSAATADSSGSTFATADAGGAATSVTGDDNRIEVTATDLIFDQDVTDVVQGAVMAPSPTVLAIDGNVNTDLDYTTAIDLSISAGGSFDGSATTSVSAIAGVATFDNLIFDALGTDFELTANSGGLNNTTSGMFDVVEPSNLFEDFDDGNFTSNPTWTGSTTAFSVISDATVPSGNASTDGSYLASNSSQGDVSLAVESSEVSEWRFSLASPTFNPSSGNNFGVVLMASASFSGDLTASNFQGYYIRIGTNGSTDRLQLWRKTGSGEVSVGNFSSSPDFDPGALDDGLNIRITRSAAGEFELFYSTGFDYSTEPTTSAGTLTDNTYSTSSYFGVFQNFSNTSTSRRVYFDNLDLITPTTYTYNGTWSPSDPNGSSASDEAIVVESGDAVISADTDINTVTVNPGASLTINTGTTLTVADATLGLTLESTSTSYSSLIADGTIAGTVRYQRFVNSNTGGNDLVSPPLNGQTWSSFIGSGTNADDLLDNGGMSPTIYAFAPFDKTAIPADYVNYDSNTSLTLNNGTGYRVATDSGATLTFTGAAQSGTVSVAIEDSGSGFEEWNLIGNPYASYISAFDFLDHNINNNPVLDNTSGAIYGYNGQTTNKWEIINLSSVTTPNPDVLIAPGQGFFIASGVPTGNAQFTTDGSPSAPDMRRTNGGNDFIASRVSNPTANGNNYNLEITLNSSSNSFKTDFYFNPMSSLGLDPGYDSKVYGDNAPDFAIYSHLVNENTGIPMGIQSLGENDLSDISIPLGVNANQGEQVVFSISETTLPSSINVYLEDNVSNTFTLLNTSEYILTPNTNLAGTGRFYIHFTNNVLSTPDTIFDSLTIYADQSNRSVNIAGEVDENTTASVYDIQGRLITSKVLTPSLRLQRIDVNAISAGVYIVELSNGNQNKTQKVILK